jgi:hypothetical protein
MEMNKMANYSCAMIKAAVDKKINEINKQISAAFDVKGKNLKINAIVIVICRVRRIED